MLGKTLLFFGSEDEGDGAFTRCETIQRSLSVQRDTDILCCEVSLGAEGHQYSLLRETQIDFA